MSIRIPEALLAQRVLGPAWGAWLDRLPRLAEDLLDEWELSVSGDPLYGFCSLVLPVRTGTGEPAAFKIALPDEESEHEALMLQKWGGEGAVRLWRADPRRRAMLLEWLPGPDLRDHWDVEACEIVAGLYSELHTPAPPRLRPLTAYVERWADGLASLGADLPMPPRLVDQALGLARDLVSDCASTGTAIHGDLHYENVLGAERAPWLAIDPKPLSGDPHYEPAPMLWNRWDDIVDDARAGVVRRFVTLVDTAGFDEARARDWVIVRMIFNAGWTVQDAVGLGRGLTAEERAWITCCITIAKAVQGDL